MNQPTAEEWYAEQQRQLERMYMRNLKTLIDSAYHDGILLQVDIVSQQPPAMGNYQQVVSSRLIRK